jgi:hypothetical protein
MTRGQSTTMTRGAPLTRSPGSPPGLYGLFVFSKLVLIARDRTGEGRGRLLATGKYPADRPDHRLLRLVERRGISGVRGFERRG